MQNILLHHVTLSRNGNTTIFGGLRQERKRPTLRQFLGENERNLPLNAIIKCVSAARIASFLAASSTSILAGL